ncbi:MAG: hypothetical protein ACPGUD_10610 [Parashewanella sp.]
MLRTTILGLLIIMTTACANHQFGNSCRAAPLPDQDGNTRIDTRSAHEKEHGCSKLDAAVDIISAIAIEASKGHSCAEKAGQSKIECQRQVNEISASINKHIKK